MRNTCTVFRHQFMAALLGVLPLVGCGPIHDPRTGTDPPPLVKTFCRDAGDPCEDPREPRLDSAAAPSAAPDTQLTLTGQFGVDPGVTPQVTLEIGGRVVDMPVLHASSVQMVVRIPGGTLGHGLIRVETAGGVSDGLPIAIEP